VERAIGRGSGLTRDAVIQQNQVDDRIEPFIDIRASCVLLHEVRRLEGI